jgi:hypothetical protein
MMLGRRQPDDLLDDAAIVAPLRLELLVQPTFVGSVADLLVSALRPPDVEIELFHLLFGRGDLGGRGRQQIAPFGGAKIRGEIVEVAKQTGIRQPAIANVRRNSVRLAQSSDAEQPEHQHQQEEEKEHRGQAETNRSRLPHRGAPRRSPQPIMATAARTGSLASPRLRLQL